MKIIIVGNGASVYNVKNGDKIDNFDYVVRMGSFRTKGYEKYVGTKTDMIRTSWDRIVKNENNKLKLAITLRCKDILFLEPHNDIFYETVSIGNTYRLRKIFNKPRFYAFRFGDILTTCNERILHDYFTRAILYQKNMFYYSINHRIELFKKYNNYINDGNIHMPSSGLCTIDYIVNNIPGEIFITGFDGFETKYYWRQTDEYFDSHSSVKEKVFLKNMIKTGVVSYL